MKYQLMMNSSSLCRISILHREQADRLFSADTIMLQDFALIALKC